MRLTAWIAAFTLVEAFAHAAEAPARRLGVASCAQSFCHGSARPLAASGVLQNEYVVWSYFDPHSRALLILRN